MRTVAFLFFFLMSSTTFGDGFSLLINGRSFHKNPSPALNEHNTGLGLQYDFARTTSGLMPFVSYSYFEDSNRDRSRYGGAGIMQRWFDTVPVDVGLFAFGMSRPGYQNGEPFFGLLPVLAIGNDTVALHITYVPALEEPQTMELWFLQLKVGIQH